MNIMLDSIIFELQRQGGISAYWHELSSRLKKSDVQICEISGSIKWLPAIARRTVPEFRDHPSTGKFIFHSSYYRINLHPSAINIVTVFDFTHRRMGSGLKNQLFLNQQAFAISRASRIICISKSTKSDLLHFFPSINPKKVDVVYVGVSEGFSQKPSADLQSSEQNRKYALFVGSRASYKNFKPAVLSVKGQSIDFVAAGPSKLTADEVDYLNQHLPGRWSFVENPTHERLLSLYRSALCLLYPSSYEGFGIPVLEGALCEIPVIACKNSSIPEVAGPSTLLVDTPGVRLLSEAISRVVSGEFNPDYPAGVQHASKFSWEQCFRETLKTYAAAIAQ